jgi:hypothetical protein
MRISLKFLLCKMKYYLILCDNNKFLLLSILMLIMSLYSTAAGVAGAELDPAVYGQWSAPFDAQIVAIHLHILPTGKVLY